MGEWWFDRANGQRMNLTQNCSPSNKIYYHKILLRCSGSSPGRRGCVLGLGRTVMREGEERSNEDGTDLSCQYLALGSERVQGGPMLEGAEPGIPVGVFGSRVAYAWNPVIPSRHEKG